MVGVDGSVLNDMFPVKLERTTRMCTTKLSSSSNVLLRNASEAIVRIIEHANASDRDCDCDRDVLVALRVHQLLQATTAYFMLKYRASYHIHEIERGGTCGSQINIKARLHDCLDNTELSKAILQHLDDLRKFAEAHIDSWSEARDDDDIINITTLAKHTHKLAQHLVHMDSVGVIVKLSPNESHSSLMMERYNCDHDHHDHRNDRKRSPNKKGYLKSPQITKASSNSTPTNELFTVTVEKAKSHNSKTKLVVKSRRASSRWLTPTTANHGNRVDNRHSHIHPHTNTNTNTKTNTNTNTNTTTNRNTGVKTTSLPALPSIQVKRPPPSRHPSDRHKSQHQHQNRNQHKSQHQYRHQNEHKSQHQYQHQNQHKSQHQQQHQLQSQHQQQHQQHQQQHQQQSQHQHQHQQQSQHQPQHQHQHQYKQHHSHSHSHPSELPMLGYKHKRAG